MDQLVAKEPETMVQTHILTTTIQSYYDLRRVSEMFDNHDGILRWSVDLNDWERVLKVVSTSSLGLQDIQSCLNIAGYSGEEMTD